MQISPSAEEIREHSHKLPNSSGLDALGTSIVPSFFQPNGHMGLIFFPFQLHGPDGL
jgi:hypothetical protein